MTAGAMPRPVSETVKTMPRSGHRALPIPGASELISSERALGDSELGTNRSFFYRWLIII